MLRPLQIPALLGWRRLRTAKGLNQHQTKQADQRLFDSIGIHHEKVSFFLGCWCWSHRERPRGCCWRILLSFLRFLSSSDWLLSRIRIRAETATASTSRKLWWFWNMLRRWKWSENVSKLTVTTDASAPTASKFGERHSINDAKTRKDIYRHECSIMTILLGVGAAFVDSIIR